MRSKIVMAAAMIINDLISFDRNKGCDPDKRIPRGRIISREECLRLVPGLNDQGLTGGALWFDAQVRHPERLVLSFLLSAVTKGAEIANYAKVIGFLEEANRIRGVRICDQFTKKVFEISSKIVVNTSGPWINQVLQLLNRKPSENWHFCRALVLVTKQLSAKIAFGVFSKRPYRDKDDLLKKGSRILFITPWQDSSLVGTLHGDEDSSPERGDVSEEEVNGFLNEVNEAYYGASLKRDDVYQVYHGLLPIVGKNAITGDAQIAKRYVIEDHAKEDGLEGLISVVGVKFTTARDVAEKTVNLALEKIGHQPVGCKTAETFLVGSKIEGFGDFLSKAVRNKPQELDVETVTHLVYQYGQAYREILDDLEKDPALAEPICPGLPVLKAQIVRAVQKEMALTLSDVIFRRTTLGHRHLPDEACLFACANLMGKLVGWGKARIEHEIDSVDDSPHGSESMYRVARRGGKTLFNNRNLKRMRRQKVQAGES